MDSVEWVREDENPEYSQKISDANYLDSLEKAKQISSNKQASSPVEYQGQTVLVTAKRRVSSTSSSNDHLSQSSSNVNIRYLSNDIFRVLTPCIGELAKRGLVKKECNSKYDGYRLTYGGYNYLAIRAFSKRDTVYSVGNQIGFSRSIALKRKNASWMYMSRLAAQKEFASMIMSLIDGFPLRQICDIKDPGKLYSSLMDLIVKLARVGLIHGDFNEFNILIDDTSNPDNPVPVLIDFPQMVSIKHENAEYYFNRDVQCIRSFFLKRFRYESRLYPKFNSIVREGKREMNLDVEVEASGWGKGESRKLEEYMEMIEQIESRSDT
ncbi:RIO1 family-domain-containing protein [Phakopsora pachyrhizi]|uniref:non-specific serine/threonine protein kinase n=1 Tax=Phakopsora pachyrhizi TaxID=170000 RepID=A0AAV0BR35_PHAPC|nr:RIO1 family-domain-containing protein [Phakopsora pachyrhizi]